MHGVNNFIFYPHDLNSLSAAQGMAGLTACPLCECRVASRRVASRSAPSTCDMAPPSARPPVVPSIRLARRRRRARVDIRGRNESNSTQGHEYIFFDARGCNHHIHP